MDLLELGAVIAFILGLNAPAPAPPVLVPSSTARSTTEAAIWGFCEVPDALGLIPNEEGDFDEAQLLGYRTRAPALFAFSPPPEGRVRMAGDFEPAQTMLLAYPGIADYDEVFSDIIEAVWQYGRVQVLVQDDYRQHFAALLRQRGIPRRAVTLISDVPFDTVWMRDYGPQAVLTSSGVAFVDGRYFVNCIGDDTVPTRLASRRVRVPVYRPDLWTEGGNLLSNGAGLCVTTSYLASQNGRSEAEIARVTRDFYGCDQTVFLEPLTGNVVQHVDMFLYFASEDVILLGQFTPIQDPVNHVILEANLARLAALRTRGGGPFTIIRVPMPDPVPTDDEDNDGPLIRSYVNMLAFNEVVLVPVYDSDPDVEQRAYATIERAYPERTLIPIAADSLGDDHGTIHCITQTIPRI